MLVNKFCSDNLICSLMYMLMAYQALLTSAALESGHSIHTTGTTGTTGTGTTKDHPVVILNA